MKNLRKELKSSKNGITLIALVITIIVLLILAGISIAMLTGQNGILSKAQDAETKTDEAEDIEKIKLSVSEAQISGNGYQKLSQNNLQQALDNKFNKNDVVVLDNGDGTFTISCLDTLKDYKITINGVEKGIDWNEAMKNAVAPQIQDETRNEGVIGIGTDGQPVDMDLWEYCYDEVTNGFALNDTEVLQNTEYNPDGTNTETIRNAGYIKQIENGKIEGKIPQYISIDNGKTFQPVTSLYKTFYGLTDLSETPSIPATIKNMYSSFEKCSIQKAFIPSNVSVLNWTFTLCSQLKYISDIPNSVYTMRGTFADCSSLETAPIIPQSVVDCYETFMRCSNLNGKLILNANLTNKINANNQSDSYSILWEAATNDGCDLKLYGSCPILDEIATRYNYNPNISLGT